MYDLRFAFRARPEAEFVEHFQHCGVLGQDLRDQFLQSCLARQVSQMTHEHGPDTLALIRIDHNESYLGLAGPHNDKASTADNDGVSVFINLRDERDVAFEIDVEEESHLPLREAFL